MDGIIWVGRILIQAEGWTRALDLEVPSILTFLLFYEMVISVTTDSIKVKFNITCEVLREY